MPEHEALARTLTPLARRLRLNRSLQALTWCICWLLAILVLHEILRALIGSPAVLSALRLLLILAAVGVVATLLVRSMRRPTLVQAAVAADAHGDLKDELKTALWFARRDHRSPVLDLLMRRACATARGLNSREIVPIVLPRGLTSAFALALVAGMLLWLSPKWVASRATAFAAPADAAPRGQPDDAQALSAAVRAPAAGGKATQSQATLQSESAAGSDGAARNTETQANAARAERRADKARLEDAVRLPSAQGGEQAAIAAPKAGDVQDPIRLTDAALDRAAPSGQQTGASGKDDSRATTTQTLESTLKQLSDSKRGTMDGGGENAIEGGAQAKEKLGEDKKDRPVQQNITEGADASEDGAPIPAHGERQKESGFGKGQGVPAAGSTDKRGGPRPEFATLTTTGGAGSPKAKPGVDIKSMGAKQAPDEPISPLQGQLRRVEIADPYGDKAAGAVDRLFTPTQSRQSVLDYQGVAPRAMHADEEAMQGERVPLAYRGTVKEYFLKLRQQEK